VVGGCVFDDTTRNRYARGADTHTCGNGYSYANRGKNTHAYGDNNSNAHDRKYGHRDTHTCDNDHSYANRGKNTHAYGCSNAHRDTYRASNFYAQS
jgi:hypothetical protein